MKKAEELKLLDKIAELIDSAGTDSYIHDTFAGVVEICRNNIVNDFGDHPVEDLELDRLRRSNDRSNMDAEIKKLKHMLDAKDAEIEKLGHLLDGKVAECENLREERDVMTECHDGLAEMINKYEAEIMRLKAEVYDLRKWGESPVVPEGV